MKWIFPPITGHGHDTSSQKQKTSNTLYKRGISEGAKQVLLSSLYRWPSHCEIPSLAIQILLPIAACRGTPTVTAILPIWDGFGHCEEMVGHVGSSKLMLWFNRVRSCSCWHSITHMNPLLTPQEVINWEGREKAIALKLTIHSNIHFPLMWL